MVSIDPKLRELGHREIDHLLRFRDDDRLAFEAPEPMPLAAMIALDGMRSRFALHQFVLWDDRGIRRPFVCAVHSHVPRGQAIHHLLQGGLVTAPAFPVEQLSRVAIEGFPYPELAPLCLEIVPHLIEFQGNRSACRLWLLLVRLGKGPDTVEYGLRGNAEEERDTVHRHTTQVPQPGVDLRGERLAAWGGAGKLVATAFTLLLGLAGSGAIVDDPITLTFGARMHLFILW